MTDTATTPATDASPAGNTVDNSVDNNGRRQRQLLLASAVFVAIGLAWLGQWFFIGRFHEHTDDAYVSGNIVQVTPQTAGTVIAIYADDTGLVHAGQPLVKLDDSDARVALDQAEAELAQTVREVRSLFTSNEALNARINLQQSELSRVQADLKRRTGLTASGAISSEELHHSEVAVKAAQADLLQAKEALSGNLALTENTSIADHPQVRAAAARVRNAYLNLQRTTIPAPVDGYVSKRSVQLGQRIAPGTPLMAVIPLQELWVDANFKESQLSQLRIGQPVSLSADVYRNSVEFRGHIVGLDAGTGSAFSLLPAQNATGNWIKVVQRVPVRIALDPEQIKAHPLRIGLSMLADVDISDDSGPQLAQQPSTAAAYSTSVYARTQGEAEALVEQIIGANAGPSQTAAN